MNSISRLSHRIITQYLAKGTVLLLAACASCAHATPNYTAPPINFNAGQGADTVTMTGKLTTMGFSMAVPQLRVKNVVKPPSEAAFCTQVKAQQYEGVQQRITTCTFDGHSGKLAGTMNISGTQSQFTYHYRFH